MLILLLLMYVNHLTIFSFPAHKVEQLQDFLPKLLEPPLDLPIPRAPSLQKENFVQIHKQYAAVMDIADRSGYIERALKSS